eukprot:TRINITY_DN29263_c1_g1_i1.p1 TRINITY_DN29263_c1_g1~~TRINITY_DN29263_c1_g1_i1.p1  ORF type:complete len:106 (-),score=5.79 TRINITY_DN29263_c1_g1_i1:105-422(-)
MELPSVAIIITSIAAACRCQLLATHVRHCHLPCSSPFLSSFSPPPFFLSLLFFPFSFNFERRERLLVKEGFDFRKERGTLSGLGGLLKEPGRDCLWAGHGVDFIK